MKHLANSIIAIAWFLSPPLTHAQGTAYLSNLGQPSAGTEPVGTDSWIAQQFGTGNNPGGYLLDSVQLLMTPATGSPSGFTVELYSHRAGSLLPGDRLGLLTGPDPAAGGTFSYSGSGLVLLPTTAYFWWSPPPRPFPTVRIFGVTAALRVPILMTIGNY